MSLTGRRAKIFTSTSGGGDAGSDPGGLSVPPHSRSANDGARLRSEPLGDRCAQENVLTSA